MRVAYAAVVMMLSAWSAACGDEAAAPPGPLDGPVQPVATGNANGDDDDPAVAVDPQGNIFVAFLSDRDGTKDLYVTHSTSLDATTGAITWSAPIQVTHNDVAVLPPPQKGDNYPSLVIDAGGVHHLAWYRVDTINAAHILYMKSDGTPAGWAAGTVVDVTTGLHYDRFPHLLRASATDLRIYFNSSTRKTAGKNDVFIATSPNGGVNWGAAAEVATMNVAGEQSTFPWVVKVSDTDFEAAFVRWKLEPSSDFLDPTSDVFYGHSADGVKWSVEQVTSDANDNQNDLVPRLFADHAGAHRLTWSTIAFGDPAADIVQMKVADRGTYPNNVTTLAPALGVADHSAEFVPVTVNGRALYVMIWVRISTPPHNQVVYRMFSGL